MRNVLRKRFYLYGLLCIYVFSSVCLLTGCMAKGITASEWVLHQYEMIPTMKHFVENTDDIVTKYVTEAMTEQDFIDEWDMVVQIYNQMLSERVEEDIRPGTFDETTKKAHDGYEQAWADLQQMVETFYTIDVESLADKNAVAYLYMAYGDKIQDDFDPYFAGYVYCGGKLEESEVESWSTTHGHPIEG